MIGLNNFKKEYQLIKDELDASVKRVLESGHYILGSECTAFEEEFADYIGAKYCISVGNGTEAIHLSLRAMGIKDGDEVITTSLTAYPTIVGILEAGGAPVLIDTHPDTCLINEDLIEEKITPRTRFILPVQLYGQCANMTRIKEISKRYNIEILEDCAQAAGAEYDDIKAGNFGSASAFSFYPTKNLGAYGDGGAVITSDNEVYERLKILRNYGQTDRYNHKSFGINSRLDELQAAILRVKLKHLDDFISIRREIASVYDGSIKFDAIKEISPNRHSYHLYVIFSDKREKLQSYLTGNDIQTLIHYPVPIHRQAALNYSKSESFPITDKITKKILSIPVNPTMDKEEINYIINTLNEYKHEKN